MIWGFVLGFMLLGWASGDVCESRAAGQLLIQKGASFCLFSAAGPQGNSIGGNWTLSFTHGGDPPLQYSLAYGQVAACAPQTGAVVSAPATVDVSSDLSYGNDNLSYIYFACGTGTRDNCDISLTAMTVCTLLNESQAVTTMMETTVEPTTTEEPTSIEMTTEERGTTFEVTTEMPMTMTPLPDDFCDQDDGICVRSGETVVVNSTGSTTVVDIDGGVKVQEGGTLVVGNNTLEVTGNIVLDGNLAIDSQCQGGVLPVASAQGNITVGAAGGVVLEDTSSCSCVDLSVQQVSVDTSSSGSSTLAVTVASTPDASCSSSSRLSTGAIVGIAIGSVVGGLLLVALIVLVTKRLDRRDQINSQVAAKRINMQGMGASGLD